MNKQYVNPDAIWKAITDFTDSYKFPLEESIETLTNLFWEDFFEQKYFNEKYEQWLTDDEITDKRPDDRNQYIYDQLCYLLNRY